MRAFPAVPRFVTSFLFALFLFAPTIESAGAGDGATVVIEKTAGEDVSFEVETAITPEQRSVGLMHRERLDPMSGMLFVYPGPQEVKMWMHATRIPLDMFFIASDGTIVKIKERAVPYSEEVITSGQPVVAVLEVNGGTASRYGIQTGDRVLLPEVLQ